MGVTRILATEAHIRTLMTFSHWSSSSIYYTEKLTALHHTPQKYLSSSPWAVHLSNYPP